MNTSRYLFRLLAVAIVAIAVIACGQKEGPAFSLSVKYPFIDGTQGSQFLSVNTLSSQIWTLTLSDGSGGTPDWITINPATGTGSKSSVSVYWERNDTGNARTAVITGACGDQTASISITQDPYGPHRDNVPGWLELPATNDPSLYFITHDSSFNKCGRNYSYYWDVNALVARWVAYPLNSKLMGSGSRTEAWALDPKLPSDLQPKLSEGGYRGAYHTGNSDGGSSYYDRGHQCPSADRLNYSDNVQTFYGTNMTPQDPDLNGKIWASLEQYVRDKSRVFDTLYVVTGCVVEGSTSFAFDNEGKKVTAPVGYYKALLGYQKSRAVGITAQTYGYTGVAFYLENRPYIDNNYKSYAMTIDELEAKTGVDFFVNLAAVIGRDLADKVEKTKDTFWNN
jgi:endonuclease G